MTRKFLILTTALSLSVIVLTTIAVRTTARAAAAAGRPRVDQRQDRHGRGRDAGGPGAGGSRRSDCRRGQQRGHQTLRRAEDRDRRSSGAARHSGVHRGARPLQRRGDRRAATEVDEDDQLGRDRVDGRGGGEDREARSMDLRPRLAPGEVDVQTGAERRGLSDARLARRGVAGQPGDPHAREWPRQLRQQPGASALRHLEDHARPARRRAPQGRVRRARRACCASARPG